VQLIALVPFLYIQVLALVHYNAQFFKLVLVLFMAVNNILHVPLHLNRHFYIFFPAFKKILFGMDREDVLTVAL